jgi:hypothetical protein
MKKLVATFVVCAALAAPAFAYTPAERQMNSFDHLQTLQTPRHEEMPEAWRGGEETHTYAHKHGHHHHKGGKAAHHHAGKTGQHKHHHHHHKDAAKKDAAPKQ